METNQNSQNKNNSSSNSQKGSSMGGMNMDNLSQQWQKYSGPIMNKVSGLSTTQKVVGGTLLAAGAGWLAMNSMNKKKGLNNTLNKTSKRK